MSYSLFRELISMTEDFERETPDGDRNLSDFSSWLYHKVNSGLSAPLASGVDWEGKENGRTIESVINTSFLHLYRYAKIYSKIAIAGTKFSTIDDVIFLINLLYLGSMSKSQLISLNIHEKSTGTLIINRLLKLGFIAEVTNPQDKRSKHVSITEAGERALMANMDKIRHATKEVVGNLSEGEKLDLMQLLKKLEIFHQEKLKSWSR